MVQRQDKAKLERDKQAVRNDIQAFFVSNQRVSHTALLQVINISALCRTHGVTRQLVKTVMDEFRT